MSHKYWALKAMSFPSEGRTAMFRNPMTEVSKFMKQKVRINFKNQGSWDTMARSQIWKNKEIGGRPRSPENHPMNPWKHPAHFYVWNLCAERGYEAHWFENRCGRLMVDDHNVPKLKELVSF